MKQTSFRIPGRFRDGVSQNETWPRLSEAGNLGALQTRVLRWALHVKICSVEGEKSSLARALRVLDAFRATDDHLSIAEVAKRASLPKTTAHRFVRDLVAWGGLERTNTGFRLGLRLFELGQLVPRQRELLDAALPHLGTLHEVTRRTVNLAVMDHGDVVYVEKLTITNMRIHASRSGGRLPVHATALGKAILAFSTPELVAEVLSGGLPRLTPHTITDPQTLQRELAAVRHRRVAFDAGESTPGLFCVAAPIFDSGYHRAIGALSVTGMRSSKEGQQIAPAVLMSGLAISRAMAGEAPNSPPEPFLSQR